MSWRAMYRLRQRVAGISGVVRSWLPGSARDTARGSSGRARSRPFQWSVSHGRCARVFGVISPLSVEFHGRVEDACGLGFMLLVAL